MQQYEQNQVWTALEPDIASETAVLLSRPPPTPSGAPSEEDKLLRATKPKKVVCMCLDRFCGICGGIPKTTKALTTVPRYMTFEAQTFLLNKNT